MQPERGTKQHVKQSWAYRPPARLPPGRTVCGSGQQADTHRAFRHTDGEFPSPSHLQRQRQTVDTWTQRREARFHRRHAMVEHRQDRNHLDRRGGRTAASVGDTEGQVETTRASGRQAAVDHPWPDRLPERHHGREYRRSLWQRAASQERRQPEDGQQDDGLALHLHHLDSLRGPVLGSRLFHHSDRSIIKRGRRTDVQADPPNARRCFACVRLVTGKP